MAKPFLLYLLKQGIGFENLACDLTIASYLLDSTRKTEHIEDVCRFLTGKQLPVNVRILKPMREAAEKRLAENGRLCCMKRWSFRLYGCWQSLSARGSA